MNFWLSVKNKIRRIVSIDIRKMIRILPVGNIILFESHNDYDGNAGAIYNFLINMGYGKKYKMIWAVKSFCPVNDNSIQVNKYENTLKKFYYQNRAKYIFFDNEPPFTCRNKNSISVYLTHGAPPLKKCKQYIMMNEFCDYAISTSEEVIDIVSEQFNIDRDKMIISGLPRYDNISANKDITEITKRSFKKYILWMPTFRKFSIGDRMDSDKDYYLGLPLIEEERDLLDIDKFLNEKDMCLIIKMHPNAFVGEFECKYSNIVILTPDILKKRGIEDISYYYSQTDALISDYSSVAFDYLLLNKPIGFILDDFYDYKLGYSVDNPLDYMPGKHIYNRNDIFTFYEDVLSGNDDYIKQREYVTQKVHKYTDCGNCKRIIERIID